MMMVGKKFPNHNLPAVLADGTMVDAFNPATCNPSGYTVVFFYPLDFTFVCPTELVAFNQALEEFKKRGVTIVGGSVDSAHSHAAWRRTALKDGGIGELGYTLISDIKRELSTDLGILNEGGVTYRASYLLDKTGTVRHMVVNDLPLGRSVAEMLRMVDALAFFEEHGEVCPAGWQKGEKGMKATRESTGEYLASHAA